MCPNPQESARLAQTSAMSYKAVTAGRPKPVPEAPRKNPVYRTGKKTEKHQDDWQAQLDQPDHANTNQPTTQSGSVHHLSQTELNNNFQNNFPSPYTPGYAEKAASQPRAQDPARAPDGSNNADPSSFDQAGEQPGLADGLGAGQTKHAVLNEEELANFRTSFCTKHHQNKCPNSDSCEKSHCLTWQRRNPYEISYCPHLCPEIQFVKKSRKMVLYRRCTRGKNCNFAHSKEEELYHPLVYKTKQCSAYPKCSRYFCPFVHDPSEMRDVSKFKSFTDPVLNRDILRELTLEEKKKREDFAETSFEFEPLETLNDHETFRDAGYSFAQLESGFSSYSTLHDATLSNLNDAAYSALNEVAFSGFKDSYSGLEYAKEGKEPKAGEQAKEKHKDDQLTQFEGDVGLWYDLPNLSASYDDSFKPLYEPYPSTEGYYGYNYAGYEDKERDEYYNANYPNLSSTASTSSNNQANSSSSLSLTGYQGAANYQSGYNSEGYYNYQENYDYNYTEDYANYDYNYTEDYGYNYDFNADYLQYNQDLEDQFNSLSLTLNSSSGSSKKEDDYSLNDMLVKFINEIGDK